MKSARTSPSWVEIQGSPRDMGLQHGRAHAIQIKTHTHQRLQLCTHPDWTGGVPLTHSEVMRYAGSCLEPHRQYASDLYSELEGIAEGSGISMEEALILNGFTDFIDLLYKAGNSKSSQPASKPAECTTFLVPQTLAENQNGLSGQTWDMHPMALPYVNLLKVKPKQGLQAVVFTFFGCVGVTGMNEAGITVSVNNLLCSDGRPGVTFPFVIRRVLQQHRIEDALQCITKAPLAGAHNYQIMDGLGNGYNIEAMPTTQHITPLGDSALVHSNHCVCPETRRLERKLSQELYTHSLARQETGAAWLNQFPVTLERVMDFTREKGGICTYPDSAMQMQTCGAVIMRPATREMWVVKGYPPDNTYERVSLS